MSFLTRRRSWLILALIALAGAGLFFYVQNKGQEGPENLEWVSATRSTIEDIVTAQGTLEPKDYVDVGVQVSGQLKKLYVDIGDEVKTGDLLAELDPQVYQSKVQGDEANINALKAQLDQKRAQADFDKAQADRALALVETKAMSQQEAEEKDKAYKVSIAAVAALEAQIAQAQASLESDQINLGYTKIYAPMDGIVSDKIAREGQTLNANQTTPKIVQIANLDVMTIRAQIAEADVMRLKPGMESQFVTLGSLERKWKGTIRQILPTPEVINDVVLYNALIDVENKDRQLMNGMSTQNSFVVGRAENVLTVPTKALGRRLVEKDLDDKGLAYSLHVKGSNGEAEERTVYIGLMTRSMSEVKSGLSEGDKVEVSGDASAAKKAQSMPRMPGMARL